MDITPARYDTPPSRPEVVADLRARRHQILTAAEQIAGDALYLADQGEDGRAAVLGRVLEHLAWTLDQLAAVADGLEAAGWRPPTPPRPPRQNWGQPPAV